MKRLTFCPLPGLSNCHLQTVLSTYFPSGSAPPSERWLVPIGNGDHLACEVSSPPHANETVVLVHGLGGSHQSKYMVRLARKFYNRGYRVVRVNLRGCGSGSGLSILPYHAGNSHDLLCVLQACKETSVHVIGFSLGANLVLKLAGELGTQANELVTTFTAVCPPIDLEKSVQRIQENCHRLYHAYYLKKILAQARPWNPQKISTIYEFDDQLTAPLWGYSGASEYYRANSSLAFLEKIRQKTHLLFSEDDPFICCKQLKTLTLPEPLHLYTTTHGGHMGFLGKTPHPANFFWLDHTLLHWILSSSDPMVST